MVTRLLSLLLGMWMFGGSGGVDHDGAFLSFPVAFARDTYPCAGEINTDNVNIRAGRSVNYEIVNQLNRGSRVRVLGIQGGWYSISPPAGTRLWIFGHYVQDGVVTCNRLNVRARPTVRSTALSQLSRGEKVIPVDERDGWLAVEPPADLPVWVSAELVDLLPEEAVPVATSPAVRDTARRTPVPHEETAVKQGPALNISGRLEFYAGHFRDTAHYCLKKGFIMNRVVACLRSERLNLGYYVGDRVAVWGHEIKRIHGDIPVIEVEELDVQ